MKLYNLKIKGFTVAYVGFAVLFTVALIMESCKKPGTTYENFQASNLRVVNGFPDRSDVKFYLDSFNLTLNGTLDYNTVSPYYVVYSGACRAKFYSQNTTDTFATDNIQLDSKKIYSLFLAGTVASPKLWLTQDDLSEPPTDKAKLRLANLALTGGNVDVTIQLTDPSFINTYPEVTVFNNIAPQTITDYTLASVPVTKGNWQKQPHTIRVYQAGTTNLLASTANVDLRGTSIETIIVTGVNGGSPVLTVSSSQEWLNW